MQRPSRERIRSPKHKEAFTSPTAKENPPTLTRPNNKKRIPRGITGDWFDETHLNLYSILPHLTENCYLHLIFLRFEPLFRKSTAILWMISFKSHFVVCTIASSVSSHSVCLFVFFPEHLSSSMRLSLCYDFSLKFSLLPTKVLFISSINLPLSQIFKGNLFLYGTYFTSFALFPRRELHSHVLASPHKF